MATHRRPDPMLGVFETMLVLTGRPVELDSHLERLAASLDALYGAKVPAGTRDLARERAAGLELGRLRLTVRPRSVSLVCDGTAERVAPHLLFPDWEDGAELRGFSLPGGLGRHKWVDRSLLPETADGTAPLLLERDGEVLEAGWGNIFAIRDDVLVTPPADGRILPGIARAAAIKIARGEGMETQERRIWREELLDADELFLTGSVRGVEPVRTLDGTALAAGEISRLVADRLRRSWFEPHAVEARERAAESPPDRPDR